MPSELERVREALRELANGLDQWEMVRVPTKYGEVFFYIGREPIEGTTVDQYDLVDLTDG